MGVKRSVDILEQSKIKPANLREKIIAILCSGKNSLPDSLVFLKAFFDETVELAQGA